MMKQLCVSTYGRYIILNSLNRSSFDVFVLSLIARICRVSAYWYPFGNGPLKADLEIQKMSKRRRVKYECLNNNADSSLSSSYHIDFAAHLHVSVKKHKKTSNVSNVFWHSVTLKLLYVSQVGTKCTKLYIASNLKNVSEVKQNLSRDASDSHPNYINTWRILFQNW